MEREKRVELARKFKDLALQRFGELIKCVIMMGSVAREEFKPKSDIDVFVILDDTQREILPEEQEKIDEELEKLLVKIPEAWVEEKVEGRKEKVCLLSVQPSYTLTEFFDLARIGHPIIYNFIKEGIPIHDVGFFAPVKRLLKLGKIAGTREAIESYMEGVPKKLTRAKTVKLLMLAEDCYYAMLNSLQAVLMFIGLPPPVPSKAYEEMKAHLVDTGLLEAKYAEWLREIVEIRKKIEHRQLLEVSGSFVDQWIQRAEEFFEKMFALLNALEIRKRMKILERTHEVMRKAVRTALQTLKKDFKEDKLFQIFEKEFVEAKGLDRYYLKVWKRIEELKGLAEQKKLEKIPDKEVYELREHVRRLIRDLARAVREGKAE